MAIYFDKRNHFNSISTFIILCKFDAQTIMNILQKIKSVPRWMVFLFDLGVCFFSVIIAYLLRFNFVIPQVEIKTLPLVLSYILAVRGLGMMVFRIYASYIRYTSTRDTVRIFFFILFGSAVFIATNIASYYFINRTFFIPFSIIIIDFLTSMFILTAYRMVVKIAVMELTNPSREKKDVIIFGAGELGINTKRALDRDAGTKYKVVAFVDDDKKKAGKMLEGVKICQAEVLDELLNNSSIEHLIISINNLKPVRKREIIETALKYNIHILSIPPVNRWINGELSFKQIKKVKIEDLLERDEIILDDTPIKHHLIDKVVLITGAAGSIGSELVKQISKHRPKQIILLDQAESPLYELEVELADNLKFQNYEIVIGDICCKSRMENIFQTFKPQVVYHAAAYKHVPMMENNPSEAIRTNIHGTKILADLSIEFSIEKFIMISTDKAVNPTNVMGASKRIAEIYIQTLNKKANTNFITTRFGNVLDSNGSVIPLFRKQIENGGPITVTHPDVTRFFMTISEACQLVLDAGAMGNGGEIFIFDMGKSVKIVDLAKKMIQLSRLTLDKDIKIIYAGLRPGEKLYEELLNTKENVLPTHHPKIMIAKVQEHEETVISKIDFITTLFDGQDNTRIVKLMKQLVPEFISNNSQFESLD